jgi:hypothetical protein
MRAGGSERPFWERALEANAPIVLWRENGRVELGGWSFDGEITVLADFWPERRVVVGMELPIGSGRPCDGGEVVFRLPSGERRVDCLLVESRCSTTERGRVLLRPRDEWLIGDVTASVESIGFGIPNFRPFRRDSEEIRLQAGEWLVAIVPAAGASDRFKQLERGGGYGVTAVGRISRIDGRQFEYREIEPLLSEVRFFLSFVAGQWTGALRPTGLDQQGTVVWERGGFPPFLDEGVQQVSWFSPDHENCLGSLFQGFHNRWCDEDAREAIRYAIYWYVMARSGAKGAEGPLVMSVAGLEIMAFWILVRRVRSHTEDEYDEKSFGLGRKLKKMFEEVGLPTGRPEMDALIERFGWPDDKNAPAGLNAMRNDLMHARKTLPSPVYKSGWWVSQWCLELCLLWAFEYQGEYLDRRNLDGPSVPVPWAARATV